jgi:5-hydroxyisourate hydrolase
MPVRLYQGAVVRATGTTDADGRIAELDAQLEPGTYRLWFDVAASNQDSFFPEVSVTFTVADERHYHVPLLLSPFAFSTYRGS